LENYEKEIFFPGGQKEENLIRLITRLMFVWFIKQMGLVPEKLFDPKELKNIVKDFGNGHNYYNAILQNLFFATLNRPINERGWAKDEGFLKNRNTFGIKSLYRYEDKFLIPPEEVLGLFENIPFINGGLFECLDKDSQYIDGFSRRPDKQAKVPDKYFFQEEEQETDLSEHGLGKAKFRGLIDIFKDYNWTTDESSPIDQEVALDPELLGKVFENLLASYNPETATTARKATGSYYTPKEIVDYMVEESLKEDFKTKTSLSEEKIEDLFYKEEPKLSDEEKKELVRAIADVKIIDPACGSGAFCMGALHKLVELLNKIDPYNELWKEEQQRRLTNELSERWEEMTQEERNEERAYLLEVFNEQRNYPDYGRKLYLIQNCIYGVDKEPIAVQLTKLRFFLSLILDQKPSNDKDNNFGILPLPHLETKFVCANTLIGLESSRRGSVGIIRTQEMMKIERELKRIRERYFRVRNRKQKQELEEKDRELREKLAELLKKQGWDNKDIQKIISFDILDPTAKADWFDPEWMFGVVDGFDVVIGNPPYVRQEKIKKDKPLLQKQGYEVFTSTADLYVYFYEKGYQLLKQQGVLAYITSNKWMRAKYGENLRKFLKEKTTIIKLIDFGGYRVFEQTVDTCILLFKKENPPKGHTFEFLTVPSNVEDLESYLRKRSKYLIEQETETVLKRVESWSDVKTWQELRDWQTAYVGNWQTMLQEKLSNNCWTLGDDKVLCLKEKIEKVGKPLKEWDVKIYRGIKQATTTLLS
jgi:adenine-specific DNA-methyltransferase